MKITLFIAAVGANGVFHFKNVLQTLIKLLAPWWASAKAVHKERVSAFFSSHRKSSRKQKVWGLLPNSPFLEEGFNIP